MFMTDDGLTYLKTYHPDPEPPRRSRLVDFWVWVARKLRINEVDYYSPHSCGGSLIARAEYEYANVEIFLHTLRQAGLDLSIFDGKRVLDAGCGWGGKMVYFSQHSQAISFDGFDLPGYDTEVCAEFARQHNVTNCTFAEGYAESMPYGDEQFDLVMLDDVLEHVKDPEKTLSECWRVLRPGGEVMIRFPSFRMMLAHHLDRAIDLPAMHYLLPMKTWAAGLNHRLLRPENREQYVPFPRVVATPYHRAITHDLNGLTFKHFKALIRQAGFTPRIMTMLPLISDMQNARRKWLRGTYLMLYRRVPPLREFLAYTIFFFGQKPG